MTWVFLNDFLVYLDSWATINERWNHPEKSVRYVEPNWGDRKKAIRREESIDLREVSMRPKFEMQGIHKRERGRQAEVRSIPHKFTNW